MLARAVIRPSVTCAHVACAEVVYPGGVVQGRVQQGRVVQDPGTTWLPCPVSWLFLDPREAGILVILRPAGSRIPGYSWSRGKPGFLVIPGPAGSLKSSLY